MFKDLFRRGNIMLQKSSVATWDEKHVPFLKENKIRHFLLGKYLEDGGLDRIAKKALRFIKTFPHKQALDGKSLVQLLAYNGFSLWWLIRQGFYVDFLEVFKEVHAIQSWIRESRIRTITLLNPDESYVRLVKEAARSKASVTCITAPCGHKTCDTKSKNRLIEHIPRLIRTAQGFLRKKTPKMRGKKENILLFTRSHVWSEIDRDIKGDANLYTLQRDLERSGKYNVFLLDVALNSESAWKAIKEKKKPFIPYDYFLAKSFFDVSIQRKLRRLKAGLRRIWNDLDRRGEFEKKMVCNRTSLYPLLKRRIEAYFLDEFGSLISAARNIEVGKKILKEYRIDRAVCVDENGASRFLVIASKICSVPSIGMQHGLIAPYGSVAYNYHWNDLHKHKGNLNCPLADQTAVFGSYFKEVLTRYGGYDSERITITGQPRMDIVFKNKKGYEKEKLCDRFGIEKGKNIVCYASEPVKKEVERAFCAVVKGLKGVKDAVLLVKVHPAEEEAVYRALLKRLGYPAIVSKDMDLYEALTCCDLLISIQSTVILEALALGKPAIQLNLAEEHDVFGEGAKEMITWVKDERKLIPAIRKALLQDPDFRKVEKRKERFISKYYHRVDGKVTERLIALVDQLPKKKS